MVEINEYSSLGEKKFLQGKNNKKLHKTLVPNKWITYPGSTKCLQKYLFIKKHQLLYCCEAGVGLGAGAGMQGLGPPVFGTACALFSSTSPGQHTHQNDS